ncbi:MAG: glycoside hydrolase family 130 protein [Lachnospiraceae bacterium]|nr:glycoside hydrolase family 130 protein [Lachnospiraceae bacterium]
MDRKKSGIKRCQENPILTVRDVKPSREGFSVKGVFNCGVAKYKDEYILLCRVAEAVDTEDEDMIRLPVIADKNGEDTFEIVSIRKSEHPEYCFEDSRTITLGKDSNHSVVYLTTLSHLRVARSRDGIHFTVDDVPGIMPNAQEECWGMEDPRITKIGDTYYINYTAVSPNGAATALITTEDFVSYQRKGLIFLPENKDVTIFPEKIGGMYYCFNRPVPRGIGSPDIWLAQSEDLVHWGRYQHFCGTSGDWEGGRIGGGAPPVRTEKGWLEIYHAADKNNRYCLGAFLLDPEHPDRVLAKSRTPLLEPETDYETQGFFGGVVFTCGTVLEKETVKIYYGAADDSICMAEISLKDIYSHLEI